MMRVWAKKRKRGRSLLISFFYCWFISISKLHSCQYGLQDLDKWHHLCQDFHLHIYLRFWLLFIWLILHLDFCTYAPWSSESLDIIFYNHIWLSYKQNGLKVKCQSFLFYSRMSIWLTSILLVGPYWVSCQNK